jgi:hypothetical protein
MTGRADSAPVTGSRLLGRVYVVAGGEPGLVDVAAALVDAGAFVAFVAVELTAVSAHTNFRADPGDPGVWERVAPYVEQRLGPVDGVVTDRATRPVVDAVFAADIRRRGHGDVVVVSPADEVVQVVSALAGRQ